MRNNEVFLSGEMPVESAMGRRPRDLMDPASIKSRPDLRVGESVFYWQEDPSKSLQGRKSGKWLKVEIRAVKGPVAVISSGATIFRAKVSKARRPLDTLDLEELPDSRERTGAPVLWLSCEGQIDVWELFSEFLFDCYP